MYIKSVSHILFVLLLLTQLAACTVVMDDDTPSANFDLPVLTPSNTIQFTVDYKNRFPVEIYVKGSRIAIDWGDGKIEKREDLSGEYPAFTHDYKKLGTYQVRIWADEITFLNTSSPVNVCRDLSIGKCPQLLMLYIGNIDGLATFDGANCPNLVTLSLSSINTLKSINLSACQDLKEVACYSLSNLLSLNVSKNAKLHTLYVSGTGLKTIDFENNQALFLLEVSYSPVTHLDFTHASYIRYLFFCDNNQLKPLDLSPLEYLTNLDYKGNTMSVLDLTGNINLQYLKCAESGLKEVRISEVAYLKTIFLNNNLLEAKALNDLFALLRPSSDFMNGAACVIQLQGNPGTNSCNRNLLWNKGWNSIEY